MVSACLLGANCRYDGSSKRSGELLRLLGEYAIIPFCPESLGKLPIPRPPAEIVDGDGAAVWSGTGRVLSKDGNDWTAAFRDGAVKSLKIFETEQPVLVVFKANSPSCGVGRIYDGGFQGCLKDGDGVTAALFRTSGATLCTEYGLATVLTEIGRKYFPDYLDVL